MSQQDFDIATGDANTGITFRAAVNAALQALASMNSGASAPAVAYPFQIYINTTDVPAGAYIRNAANTAWVKFGYVDAGTGKLMVFNADTAGACSGNAVTATNADTVDSYHAASLLARSNHTGTQAIATLSDHNKMNHDSLFINADTVNGAHASSSIDGQYFPAGTILVTDSAERLSIYKQGNSYSAVRGVMPGYNGRIASAAGVAGNGGDIGVLGFAPYSTGAGVVGRCNGLSGYDFYADGNGVNYGPFTGAHDGLILKSAHVGAGDIVVDFQIINKANLSNCIFENQLSSQPMQAGAVGVFAGRAELLIKNVPSALLVKHSEAVRQEGQEEIDVVESFASLCEIYDSIVFNALGEGQINVCREGGNINVGDLICTSSTPGKGMKQPDNIYRNYTVARAREAVTWEPGDDSVKQIACIYLCG